MLFWDIYCLKWKSVPEFRKKTHGSHLQGSRILGLLDPLRFADMLSRNVGMELQIYAA